MKLDRRHLIGSLFLLTASIVYNVWVFTRPAGGPVAGGTSAPVSVVPQGGDSPAASAPAVDVTQLPPLPDVELDRLPEWPRDPFVTRRTSEPESVQAVGSEPAPPPEPDPVVASILYSPDRQLAMIDGRVTRVGDAVGGATVVEIRPNAVVIESAAGGRRTLTLRPPGAPR